MSTQLSTVVSELPQLLGPVLIGAVFSGLLAGAFITQAIYYFCVFRADHRTHRLVILLLTINSLLSFGNVLAVVWRIFIETPANPALLLEPSPGNWELVFFTPTAATFLSQSFFATRAWAFHNRRLWLAVILFVLVAGHLAVGLAVTIVGSTARGRARGDGTDPTATRRLTGAGLVTGAAVDLILTGLLVLALRRTQQKSKEGQRGLLRLFLRWTIATGFASSCMAAVTAIMAITTAQSARFATLQDPLGICLPHVTALCVVGTLNLRTPRRQSYESIVGSSAEKSGLTQDRTMYILPLTPGSHLRSTPRAFSSKYEESVPKGRRAPPPSWQARDSKDSSHFFYEHAYVAPVDERWAVPWPPQPVERRGASTTIEPRRPRRSNSVNAPLVLKEMV